MIAHPFDRDAFCKFVGACHRALSETGEVVFDGVMSHEDGEIAGMPDIRRHGFVVHYEMGINALRTFEFGSTAPAEFGWV